MTAGERNAGAGLGPLFERVCRAALAATGATRASVWYFESDGSIVCERLHDIRTPSLVQAGMTIARSDHAAYLDAVRRDGVVNAGNARHHPATRSFNRDYFEVTDIHALLDFLVRDRDGRPAAILCCEQCEAPRTWTEADVGALRGLATTLADSFRYQAGTAAQRAAMAPAVPFADTPLLLEAALYWAAKRSSRPMPHRRDISPIDMPRMLLPSLVIAELLADPFRVRIRLVGTEIVERYGMDFTGQLTTDFMTGDYLDYVNGLFRRVADSGAPVYSESQFRWNQGGFRRTRRLMLPLSLADDCGSVDQVLLAQAWPDGDQGQAAPWAQEITAESIDAGLVRTLDLPGPAGV